MRLLATFLPTFLLTCFPNKIFSKFPIKKVLFIFFSTIASVSFLFSSGLNENLSGENDYLNWSVHITPQVTPSASSHSLNFNFKLKQGFHINSNKPNSENYIPTVFTLEKNALAKNGGNNATTGSALYSLQTLKTDYPQPILNTYYGQELSVYEADGWKTISLEFSIDKKKIFSGEQVIDLPFNFTFQPCDANVCFPPEKIQEKLTLTYASLSELKEAAKPFAWDWSWSWLGIIFAAWFGGLLLNFMPCILPILSLKAYSLLNQKNKTNWNANNKANDNIRKKKYSLLSFIVGSWLSFFLLAILLLAIRSLNQDINWGLQFQNPFFILTLIIILWLLSLTLLDVFNFELGAGIHFSNPKKKFFYLAENFLSGFFLSVFSTSCTAPFLGVAIGYALTQSNLSVIMIFSLIGLGFITPYLLFFTKASSNWFEKYFPKPGQWMLYFKRFSALPILLIIIWFINILETILFFEVIVWLMVYLAGISFVFYAWGLIQKKAQTDWKENWKENWKKNWKKNYSLYRVSFFSLFMLITFFLYFSLGKVFFNEDGKIFTESYPTDAPDQLLISDEAQKISFAKQFSQNLQEGNIFFVHYTAKWCINCKVNEVVLEQSEVRNFFTENNINYLEADWTKPNSFISKKVKEVQRAGIPLDVFYEFNNGQLMAHVLPTFLTSNLIQETFLQIKQKK